MKKKAIKKCKRVLKSYDRQAAYKKLLDELEYECKTANFQSLLRRKS